MYKSLPKGVYLMGRLVSYTYIVCDNFSLMVDHSINFCDR